MAHDTTWKEISNKDIRWAMTLTHQGSPMDLHTIEFSGSLTETNSAEMIRNGAGKPIGRQAGDSGGGSFSFSLAWYEFHQLFGLARLAGARYCDIPFVLTGLLPLTEPDTDNGGEITAYGADRMIVLGSCWISGDVPSELSPDSTAKITVDCQCLDVKQITI